MPTTAEHPIIEITPLKGEIIRGKWSGPLPLPQKGTRYGIPFGNQCVPSQLEGYFEEAGFVAARLQLETLPSNVGSFNLLPNEEDIAEKGTSVFTGNQSPRWDLCCGLFGGELDTCIQGDQVPSAPNILTEYDLGAEEEYACLMAAILCIDKDWKSHLHGLWMNGAWQSSILEAFSSQLQTVRNTQGMELIEWSVSKNKEYVTRMRRAIRNR